MTETGADIFTETCEAVWGIRVRREYRFDKGRRWRFDYAVPEGRVALEVEGGVWSGGRHIRGAGFVRDMEKYNAAVLQGWRVLRCTPETLMTEGLEMIRAICGRTDDGRMD